MSDSGAPALVDAVVAAFAAEAEISGEEAERLRAFVEGLVSRSSTRIPTTPGARSR